jgi:hypothetical protein
MSDLGEDTAKKELIKTRVKETVADKVIPWLLLIVIGPLVILGVGAIAKIHPFGRGDLYFYDLGLLLAGFAEALAERQLPHRQMQAMFATTVLLAIALAIFWVITSKNIFGDLGARWWMVIVVTLITGLVAFSGVYIGAMGAARTEVRR